MAYISMSDASRQFHVSKPTLSRAVKSGALSVAEKRPDGSFWFDPAEVERFISSTRNDKRSSTKRPVSPQETAEMAIANARLEEQLAGLRHVLDIERQRLRDLEADRDQWRDQAKSQTLLLTQAAQAPQEHRSGLFGWLSGRKVAKG
jgi:hypothetical protein